jgi:hypothetical protein
MNDRPKNWINPKIATNRSPIHGRGIFAVKDIDKGELLIIWRECYTNKVGAMKAIQEGKGIMQWDDDVFSYETDIHKEDYMINHSCDPNSWMADSYTLEARRKIGKGEEITVDIALFESDEDSVSSWRCNCGSPVCRGRVTGKDWMRKDLRKRYKGHFSPLLNKRIEGFENP